VRFGRRQRRDAEVRPADAVSGAARLEESGVRPADAMAAIVASIAPSMKAAGFRKRRHTFNRRVGDDGFVQMLNFQMGAFDPPGTVEIPGLRPNLYGRFTVNLGVFVPAIQRGGLAERDWYSDYHCQVRKLIGELLDEQADVWWRLDRPDTEADVAATIRDHGLPWLARFENYVGLLDLWGSGGGAAVGLNYPAAPLDIADVLLHLGRKSDAEAVLRDYVGKEYVVGHADVVRTYLLDRGFGDLIDAGG